MQFSLWLEYSYKYMDRRRSGRGYTVPSNARSQANCWGLVCAVATLLLLLSACAATTDAEVPPPAVTPTHISVDAAETVVPLTETPEPPVVEAIEPARSEPQPVPTDVPTPVPPLVENYRTPRAVVYAPILVYHSFNNAGDAYSVRPRRFQEQLAALKAAGFTGVTMHQIVEALDNGAPLPSNPVAITMDDARSTQKTAIDILEGEGFPVTMFVPSGWHELSREFVAQLDQKGVEIGSHTVWHVNLARSPQKRSEIREGKKAIEDWLGHAVEGFAFPYGAYRPADVDELRRVGFRYALGIRHGVALRATERYRWPRMLVSNDDPTGLVKRLQTMLSDARAGREPPAPTSWG